MNIIGTGKYLPKQIITNDDLTKIVDTSDEWIYTRTGIHSRHIAETETTSDMAASAALQALHNSSISAKDIDLIITATISAESSMPSVACRVQAQIGADHAAAFDINAACSGFIFALNTAFSFLQSSNYKTVLVIGAESLSRQIDWTDRSTCVLFGDGAGAVIVQKDSRPYHWLQFSDGSKSNALTCDIPQTLPPFAAMHGSSEFKTPYIKMDGQEVFKFAVKKVPECIQTLLLQTKTDLADIKYILLHQANKRIIQSVAKRLHLDEERFPINLDQYGNTSGATIPILLDELNQENKLKKDDKLILCGFGAGLTWACSLLEW